MLVVSALLTFLSHHPYSFAVIFSLSHFLCLYFPALAGRQWSSKDCLPSIPRPFLSDAPSPSDPYDCSWSWSSCLEVDHLYVSCLGPQLSKYPVLRQKTVYKGLGHNGRLGIFPLQPCG